MGHWDPNLPVTSSHEPQWSAETEECYRDALQVMLDAGLPFVVGGAFAIHRHTGIWRTTKDLDFFLPADAIPEAHRRMRAAGFKTWIEDPVWLAKASRGDNFVDLITGVGNASLCVDESWVERGLPETVLGIECKVQGPEECVASKIFVAFRERFDGADVAHLVRSCGPTLDWNRILQLVGCHWDLLYWSLVLYAYVYPAHTDCVPGWLWNDLNARFVDRLRAPDRTAPFRGSLVDPRMFAIDSDEWGERNLYREYCENHPCLLHADEVMGSKE
jgi:hypothetical protein